MYLKNASATKGQRQQLLAMIEARLEVLGLSKKQAQSIIVSGREFCPAVETMFRELLALPTVATATDKKIRSVYHRLSECSNRW